MSVAIAEAQYREFFMGLLAGDRTRGARVLPALMAAGTGLKDLYVALFQRALYEGGDRRERCPIAVTVEHVASAIVESDLIVCPFQRSDHSEGVGV
jgi:MerR family transcriptional regulator, light-induced transcriptional regulator